MDKILSPYLILTHISPSASMSTQSQAQKDLERLMRDKKKQEEWAAANAAKEKRKEEPQFSEDDVSEWAIGKQPSASPSPEPEEIRKGTGATTPSSLKEGKKEMVHKGEEDGWTSLDEAQEGQSE